MTAGRAHALGTRGLYPRDAQTVGTRGLWYPVLVDEEEPVLDDTLVSTIYEIVEKFGKDIVFVDVNATYAESTGYAGGAEQLFTRKCTPPEMHVRFVVRDLVKYSGVRMYLPTLSLPFNPALGMEVRFGGDRYRIVRRTYIYSIQEVGAYELILVG